MRSMEEHVSPGTKPLAGWPPSSRYLLVGSIELRIISYILFG